MAYKNIEELVKNVEKFHPVYVWCDLSNYLGIKKDIAKALEEENIFVAFKEMSRLVGIYNTLTRIPEYEYWDGHMNAITEEMAKSKKTLDDIQKDFLVATTEIEYEYCHHGLTGDFKITKEAIETDWKLVDWEAYHNANIKNLLEACKKADKLYGIDQTDIIEYYADDSRFNFIEVYPMSYAGRVFGVFDNEDDAYHWCEWLDDVEKIDGLFYVNHCGY